MGIDFIHVVALFLVVGCMITAYLYIYPVFTIDTDSFAEENGSLVEEDSEQSWGHGSDRIFPVTDRRGCD